MLGCVLLVTSLISTLLIVFSLFTVGWIGVEEDFNRTEVCPFYIRICTKNGTVHSCYTKLGVQSVIDVYQYDYGDFVLGLFCLLLNIVGTVLTVIFAISVLRRHNFLSPLESMVMLIISVTLSGIGVILGVALCVQFGIANRRLGAAVDRREYDPSKPQFSKLMPFSLFFCSAGLAFEFFTICIQIKYLVNSCRSRDKCDTTIGLTTAMETSPDFNDPVITANT